MSEREYPNVWPDGGVFAFSGLDGPTRYDEPFTACGMSKRVGWRFLLSPGPLVVPFLDGRRYQPQHADRDYVFADAWRVTVLCQERKGLVLGAFVDHDSIALRIAFKGLAKGVYPELLLNLESEARGLIRVVKGDGWWLALLDGEPAADRGFGLAISYRSEEEAITRAAIARDADLNALIEARLEPYGDKAIPDGVCGLPKRTYLRASSVLRAHVHSPQQSGTLPWTAPERNPKRHRWLWESAVMALGWQAVRVEMAEACLSAVFARQRPSGKLGAVGAPGAGGSDDEEAHLPLFAWTAWELYSGSGRGQSLERWYPALQGYLDWFDTHRGVPGGLYGWRRAGGYGADVDAGMPGAPRFDTAEGAQACADLSAAMASEYYHMAKIAEALDKRSAAAEWRKRHGTVARAMNERLWDEQDRFYYDSDGAEGHVFRKYAASFLALLGRVPDRDQAEALRVHLMLSTEFYPYVPVATMACDEAVFALRGWSGPVWPMLNAPLVAGLKAYGFVEEAAAVALATQREIERWYKNHGVFYPSYDPQGNVEPDGIVVSGRDGAGRSVAPEADFAPTAAVYLHFHHRAL